MREIKNKFIREVGVGVEWITPPRIRKEYPERGFPKVILARHVENLNIYPVYRVDPPVSVGNTQKVVWDILPSKNSEGVYVQDYQIVDKTQEELLNDIPWKNLDQAQIALAQWINRLTFQIEGKYPEVIQKAWKEEEEAALAFKLGEETPDQLNMLTVLGAKKNRTADEQADRVLWLAGTYRAIKDVVHELWMETDAELENAVSPLQYPAIFEAATAKAAPLAAQFNLTIPDEE